MSLRSSSLADNVAILARNRRTGQTVQRITSAETVAGPEFQSRLRNGELGWGGHFHRNEPTQGRGSTVGRRAISGKFATSISTSIQGARTHSRPFATRLKFPRQTLSSIPLPANTRSFGEWKDWTGNRPSPCCAPWPTSLAAIRQRPTPRGFFVCRDSRIRNTTKNSSFKLTTNQTRFITHAIS